jgi:hypothetical protein
MENKPIILYFNEELHKYTDDRGYTYTSMTTAIGKYEIKFEEKQKEIAEACSRSRNSQYYGMGVQHILKLWKQENAKSLVKGNRIHNYLEEKVKLASGYKLVDNYYINDKIYTVNNFEQVLSRNNMIGELDLDFFVEIGIADKYPRIYKLIKTYVSLGYRIFSEIGIFDADRLISGLIDILFINFNTKEFVILDWKTNKHALIPFNDDRYKWISGYFKKDKFGQVTNKFIKTNTYFKHPLNRYQQSHYLIYALQLSGYASLVERLGYINKGIVLAHIREELKYTADSIEVSRIPSLIGKDVTDLHQMIYLKDDIDSLFEHHFNTYTNQQATIL